MIKLAVSKTGKFSIYNYRCFHVNSFLITFKLSFISISHMLPPKLQLSLW